MRRTPFALLLALSFSASASVAAQALPPVATVARVTDSLAHAFLAAKSAPSVSVALVRGKDTIVVKAWGMADLELNVPTSPASVYRIGSVTKQFTSSLVLQLVEQGKVKLDDSIAVYLPALPVKWRAVTVRQLLNHTSGIPSYTDVGDRWQRRWGEEMTPDTIVAMTANDSMWFAPGTKWRYDNTGYIVLGMLIEKVTGISWKENVSKRLLDPLGLKETSVCLTEPIIMNRVSGYQKEKDGWENAPYIAMSQPYAAGSMCATARDLSRWNEALHGGKVLSAASYQMMTTPEGAAAKGDLAYGFGIGADTLAGRKIITHGGGIHGFASANAWVPDARLSITVLGNAGGAPVGDLMKQIVRAALGVPLVQPPKVQTLSAAERARYAGVYALMLPNGARDFTIADEGDHLTAQLAGQGANPMLYLGNDTFGMAFDPTLRLVFTVENGRAVKVALAQGGGHFEGARK
jgi:CubicO group peptidase (beta-lactamase class C family)